MAKLSLSKYRSLLTEITNIPTVAGYEQNVVQYIEAFVGRRKNALLKKDRFGNLHIRAKHAPRTTRPIIITAHTISQ